MDFLYAKRIAFFEGGNGNERISILKRYLNELVAPSPKLEINNEFTPETARALQNFKFQFRKKNLQSRLRIDASLGPETWAAIGVALGAERLKEELSTLTDSGLKRMLQGLTELEYTQAMRVCDQKLADVFGGEGAAVMSIIEPPDLRRGDGSLRDPYAPSIRPEPHNAVPRNDIKGSHERGGIIHVYTNPQGLPADVGLYAPQGFKQIFEVKNERGKVIKLEAGPNNILYFYSNQMKIYITFAHAKTKGVSGIGTKKSNGSVKIGNIGGPGGDGTGEKFPSYIHSHLSFYSEFYGNVTTGTRVDPRDYFCK